MNEKLDSYLSRLRARLQAMRLRFRAPLAFGAGALCVLAMPPWDFTPALLAGFSFFYLLLAGLRGRFAPFGVGWLFAFGYFLTGLSWIGNALLVAGNDFSWAWPLEIAGLPALLALFPAAGFAIAARFVRFEKFSGLISVAALVALCEWGRGHLLTGYPWNLFAYTWAGNLPVAQAAAWIGAYGLNFLTLVWMALPGWLLLSRDSRRAKTLYACAVLLSFIACFAFGAQRLKAHPDSLRSDIAARLVQANIPQDEKWDADKESENLRRHLALSWPQPVNDHVTTLVIWPETSLSDFVTDVPEARQAIANVLSYYKGPVYLISGYLRHSEMPDGSARYYNSLAVFDRGMNLLTAYNKSHLVPFGEYIPFQKYLPLKPFVEFSGFTPGNGPQTYDLPGVGALGMSICYELIFPGAVIGRHQERPDWIVNVTNDGWYGRSSGPYQHFAQGRFRAIEEGVPLVRAASTGISGVVGPTGRIIYESGLLTADGANVALPRRLEAPTFYSEYKDLLFFIALAASFALWWRAQRPGR
jgi:apolipoprotein N-acyltransferase